MHTEQKKKKFTDEEIARLCLELSLFVHSGMDMGAGLRYISEKQSESSRANDILRLSTDISSGISLFAAFEKSELFPANVISMLKIGEITGRPEEAVTAISEYYKKRASTIRRLYSAILYPSVLFAVMLAVIILLLTKVLPIFNDVYLSIGGGLTGAAGALLRIGQLLKTALPILPAIILACAVVFIVLFKKGVIRKSLKKHPIVIGYKNAQFAQALHMGIASGLSVTEAIEYAGQLHDEERISECLALLGDGASFSEALDKTKLLPSAECRLLEIALLSGTGEEISEKISEQLKESADTELDKYLSVIEPVLVLSASILVGAILISVMLPLTGLMTGMV